MQNKIAGSYKITNTISGELYIGSSKDIKRRWANHKSPSTQKHLPNSKLYQDMSEFGLDNFKFEVLEETTDLREREQYYIEQLKPTYNDRYADGYNIKRRKKASRRRNKEWYKAHRNEKLAYNKAYNKAYYKAYHSRVCFYEGETLTLNALSKRLKRQGIPHSTLEAKKYLIVRDFHNFY